MDVTAFKEWKHPARESLAEQKNLAKNLEHLMNCGNSGELSRCISFSHFLFQRGFNVIKGSKKKGKKIIYISFAPVCVCVCVCVYTSLYRRPIPADDYTWSRQRGEAQGTGEEGSKKKKKMEEKEMFC